MDSSTSQAITTICPFCGVGCGMTLQVQKSGAAARLTGIAPQLNHPISRGQLCAKGWSTPFAIDAANRIKTPLQRTPDGFRPISWAEALKSIGESIRTILEEDGPQALGVISSARATNEDNYAAQKFARAVLRTNNVDHCARICHSPTVAGLKQTLGSGAMTNSASDIGQTDLIMVFGADPTENHSILGGHILRAREQGTRLIVVDPRKTRLARIADLHLQLHPGSNIALVNALLAEIFANDWQDNDFLATRCEGHDALRKSVAGTNADASAVITGVPVELMRAAAREYSQAKRAMILYGMGVTQYVSGTNNVIALSNLALACGQIGRPGTGVNPLRGQNNVQGACDMGCLPNVYPGYQPVAEEEVRNKFARVWQTPVAEHTGLTSLGMTLATLEDKFRGLILFGEDPVVTDPDQTRERRALDKLDLLVVAELTMTETAKQADFVLPAASFAEKDGTFTNCERRVQRVRKALPSPGEARADWQWLGDIARELGSDALDWESAEEIFDELAALTPIYSGMTYAGLDREHGLQWPCNKEAPSGTAILHSDRFPIGRARLIPVHHVEIDEPTDDQFPLVLTTNRLHFHYGCGSMSRKSPLLERETPDGILFINSFDAHNLSLSQHSPVRISSRRGFIETRAIISDEVPAGLVTMPYHFREAPSNRLTNNAMDPVTKMPELKACAVRVDPLPADTQPRTMDEILADEAREVPSD